MSPAGLYITACDFIPNSSLKVENVPQNPQKPRDSQDRESDIDILVVLHRVDRQIEEELFDIAYDVELKYDCLIDLIVFGKDALNGRISHAPVYVRAMEEGVVI